MAALELSGIYVPVATVAEKRLASLFVPLERLNLTGFIPCVEDVLGLGMYVIKRITGGPPSAKLVQSYCCGSAEPRALCVNVENATCIAGMWSQTRFGGVPLTSPNCCSRIHEQ